MIQSVISVFFIENSRKGHDNHAKAVYTVLVNYKQYIYADR